jgi:hypothetical protein
MTNEQVREMKRVFPKGWNETQIPAIWRRQKETCDICQEKKWEGQSKKIWESDEL